MCSGSTNSDWSIDHDDASSWFEDSQNVMVCKRKDGYLSLSLASGLPAMVSVISLRTDGSHKWRDGVHKHYFENLYVIPEDATPNAEWGIGW